jgi:hypothetical protein
MSPKHKTQTQKHDLFSYPGGASASEIEEEPTELVRPEQHAVRAAAYD